MIVHIPSDAEEDLIEGYWFYERQSPLEPESLLDASGRPVDTGQRGMEDADGAVPAAPDSAGSPRTCEVDECIRK